MNKKNTNYNGIIIDNSKLTSEMLAFIEDCVRGTDEPVANTFVVPEHVREEYLRAGLPASGLYDGLWLCSEKFKGNWAQLLNAGNNRTMILFTKRPFAKYLKVHPNCVKF